eukprot:m.1014393 g.1014393  ORF g.1014393 m.1014393 type:complete len:115 (-) comp24072_c0_seq3:4533-4877(-)
MGGSTSSETSTADGAIIAAPPTQNIADENMNGHYVGERVLLKGTGGRWWVLLHLLCFYQALPQIMEFCFSGLEEAFQLQCVTFEKMTIQSKYNTTMEDTSGFRHATSPNIYLET